MKIDVDAQARLLAVVKRAGTQAKAAQELGCSQSYVHELLKGTRGFSEPMLAKLGLRRTVIEAKS
jgi:predicted transcriptional regulator